MLTIPGFCFLDLIDFFFGESCSVTVGCSGYPISNTVNEHPSAALRPAKRVRDVEPNYCQQKLQISLNNNFGQNEVDQAGSILNPITVSTGLRLSYEEKERNSSVTSAPENMKAALPALQPIDSGFKYEIDRHREEFDHYMKAQVMYPLTSVKLGMSNFRLIWMKLYNV